MITLCRFIIVLSLTAILGCSNVVLDEPLTVSEDIDVDGGTIELPTLASVTLDPGILEDDQEMVITRIAESGVQSCQVLIEVVVHS